MSERENLTTRDLAESGSTGAETAEDMPLTREQGTDDGREAAEASGPDTASGTNHPAAGTAATEPLLPAAESDRFEQRWAEIQTSFVDEPRRAVEEADTLVAELMQELAAGFSETRSRLEAQWDNEGDDASTEDLRVALTRYRSFFNRLLSA